MTTFDASGCSIPFFAVGVVYSPPGVVLAGLAQQTAAGVSSRFQDPPTVGRDHADLGKGGWPARWWGIVLIALVVVIGHQEQRLQEFRWGPHGLGLACSGA